VSKTKTIFVCASCGAQAPKWAGQCGDCGAWNTLAEEIITASARTSRISISTSQSQITKLIDVSLEQQTRISTGARELDCVLGGGLVLGSVVLLGGDPGVGKSTLLLQTLCYMSENYNTLYVSGEESLQQIRLHSQRLGLIHQRLNVLADIQVESILAIAEKEKPDVMVVDSIQTLFTDRLQSAPGSVSQVRECASQLVRFAKQTGMALFIVGHVTKEGMIAGPRILEHMVDTVLYFEGELKGRYRVVRAVKNRFGAINELGVFAMTDKGLKEVTNPSAIFLSRGEKEVSGSVVMVTWEGTRPLLVEIQALVDSSHLGNPRRVTVGLDYNRLSMLLAVLHRHGGVATYDQDVFVNVVGGIKVLETAIDLPVILSVISSLKDKPLPRDLVVFGEVGLAGEIRPVPSGQERLKEAAKHGFKKAIVPKANAPKQKNADIEIIPVQNLNDVLKALRQM